MLGASAVLTGTHVDAFEVLDDAQPSPKAELGWPFGSPPCTSQKPPATMSEILDRGAMRIRVHAFDREWRNLETIRAYIERLLSAPPEGGALFPTVYWAEGGRAEVIASVEFANGQRRPLHLANGYVHVQDAAGCEWWARYLGGEQSKWVVRP